MDYAAWANIQRLNGIIAGDLDPKQRRIILRVLAHEKAKLAGDVLKPDRGAEADGEWTD